MALLECVPNISEGRRLDVVERLATGSLVPGVRELDRASDPDHNRSVFTWVGEPEPLAAAAVALARLARDTIDLGQHQGVHPCLGALDVVPFVPLAGALSGALSGAPMALAIAAARKTARAIAEEVGVPTFLYGHAASDPSRASLAGYRRGGDAAPDFGGPLHPTAGAVLVGARNPLVAFNVALDTAELTAAREIASRIRETAAGGLPGVRALGFSLESRGCVQVSVNLVDARATSLAQLVDRIRREAERLGIAVGPSELVGLATEDAVRGASAAALGLPGLDPRQLLEHHLAQLAALPPEPSATSGGP